MNFFDNLSYNEYIELEADIYEILYNDLTDNILLYNSKNFYDELTYMIIEILSLKTLCQSDEMEEVEKIVLDIVWNFFEIYQEFPRREYKYLNNVLEKQDITQQINNLRSIPQPQQRTEEWYLFRHNILTASNLWKIFNTESTYNSFIYEKCKPYSQGEKYGFISSLNWGKIFEPVSISIYEEKYNTKIEDFGCIINKNIPYLGASPDGINVNIDSNLYGRMLEVKNIVNREINGIPKEDYWIQMQLQLECCDLEYCDFLETRFKEYENEDDFYNKDSNDYEYKGIIISFTKDNETENKYLPINFDINRENIKNWKTDTINEMLLLGYQLKKEYYWYLDEFSCVVIKRNRLWFDKAKEQIKEVWDIIQKEKKEGYEHRNTKKKQNKTELSDKIFLQLQDDKYTIYNMPNDNKLDIVKIE